jgi:hypothetical protein
MPSAPSEPRLVIVGLLLAALICTGLCLAAILAPAPTAVAPLIAVVCVGGPIFAGWHAPGAVASLRAERKRRSALGALRRSLEELPEVEHPLGF